MGLHVFFEGVPNLVIDYFCLPFPIDTIAIDIILQYYMAMSAAKEAIDDLQADLVKFVAEQPHRWFISFSMPIC